MTARKKWDEERVRGEFFPGCDVVPPIDDYLGPLAAALEERELRIIYLEGFKEENARLHERVGELEREVEDAMIYRQRMDEERDENARLRNRVEELESGPIERGIVSDDLKVMRDMERDLAAKDAEIERLRSERDDATKALAEYESHHNRKWEKYLKAALEKAIREE